MGVSVTVLCMYVIAQCAMLTGLITAIRGLVRVPTGRDGVLVRHACLTFVCKILMTIHILVITTVMLYLAVTFIITTLMYLIFFARKSSQK